MKKFIFMLLIVILSSMMLSVDATPNIHFSKYDPSYTIKAGNSTPSQAWALYLDEELRESGKNIGKDILIGNFYDNSKIREIWGKTNLPPESSKGFNILQINGYTVITGNESTLPELTRLFDGEYNLNSPTFFMFLTISIFTFLFFLYLLRKAPYARSLYFLSVLTLTLWVINGHSEFGFEDGFFKGIFYEALKLNFNTFSREPLSYPIFIWGKAFGFTLFSMHLLHFYLLFLIISLMFYLAPKHSRELGFLIFGLTFALPIFRTHMKILSGDVFILLLFELLLVIGTNFSFAPNKALALFEVGTFGALTSISILLMPASFIIPVSFITVYPKRFKRNYIYLLSVLILYAFLSAFFKVDIRGYFISRTDFVALKNVARESIVQFALFAYSCMELKKKRIIGQTWFVGVASLLYMTTFIFMKVSELPLFLLLSTFAIRLTQKASQT